MSTLDKKAEALQLPLTGLDKAFAKYLQEVLPSSDPRHELLAALTSYQFGRGHACLDLDLLSEKGATTLDGMSRSMRCCNQG
jgi:exodeoxyribonuclease V alpha subunit